MEITDINGRVTLGNATTMPYFGLGLYQMEEGEEVFNAVTQAIAQGYRLFDTAAAYDNEAGVGKAIRESPVAREEIFVTSKVWNSDHGYENTLKAFDRSIRKMKLDYLDLYLIHWPVKKKYKETWRAIETLYMEGRIKAIGVSNFLEHHLEDLMTEAKIFPMVNQVEFHPYLVQPDLLHFCRENDIQVEAWSPLMQGNVTDIAELKEIADKYEKKPSQVTLRWDLQKGVVTIPKSSNPEHIRSNAEIFDFELSLEDMETIDNLNQNSRLGDHPDHI
jgi:diketogulonate reductase-like aldo/keto reductase